MGVVVATNQAAIARRFLTTLGRMKFRRASGRCFFRRASSLTASTCISVTQVRGAGAESQFWTDHSTPLSTISMMPPS